MPYKSQWAAGVVYPENLFNFEDCAFLFNNTNKATRGIIRMNIDEAALLWRICRYNPGNVAEVGRAEGGSTLLMAAAAKPYGVFSIDLDPVDDENLMDIATMFGLRLNIELCVGDSQTMDLSDHHESYSVVFIDGDHTYAGVKADFENWLPTVKIGGRIAFHDVNDPTLENHGPSQLYAELIYDKRLEEEATAGSLKVFRRLK